VSSLLAGVLGVLLATNQPAALSNWIKQSTGITASVPDPNDPAEKELARLMELDNTAQEEVDRWIQDNEKFKEQGAGLADATLNIKIEQRYAEIRRAYEEFLKIHPQHARARIAFGSFLNDIGQEEEARDQWIKATETDPKNAAAWNNLANYYGHRGPVTNAFKGYAKAIELSPREPVYIRNLATTLFLFRQDAIAFLGLDEQQVFDRSLALYREAVRLDPTNFIYASDLAQTYYGIKPDRPEDAKSAWKLALKLAHDSIEQQGIYIHLARWDISSRHFESASNYLDLVALPMYSDLKKRLLRNLADRQAPAKSISEAIRPQGSAVPPVEVKEQNK
jgi:tetratricopeptide (TPR) repeat protein